MAEWLRYWTLKRQIVGLSPAIGLLCLKSLGKMCTPNVPRVSPTHILLRRRRRRALLVTVTMSIIGNCDDAETNKHTVPV